MRAPDLRFRTKIVWVAAAACFWGGAVFGQTSPLSVSANAIDFDRPSGDICASGDVKLIYEDFTLSAERVSFNYQDEKFKIPGPFTIRKDDYRISAEDMQYDFKTFKGSSKHVAADIERVHIHGEKLEFNPNSIVVYNASFTSCDLKRPHFLIHAEKIYLYPEFGFFVAFQNYFQLGDVPILWFPTYIYGSQAYRFVATSTPIPEVGSNVREGFFVREKLGYYIDNGSSGTIDLGYLSNLGLYYGFTHGFLFGPAHQIGISAHALGSDGWGGGAIYRLSLAPTLSGAAGKSAFEHLFLPFTQRALPLSQITLRYMYGELLNNSRVNYVPDISSDLNQFELFGSGLVLNGSLSAGYLQENTPERTNIASHRVNATGIVNRDFPLSEYMHLNLGVNYYGNWYDQGKEWQRFFAKSTVSWNWPVLKPEISYTKRLSSFGSSPFEFEAFRAIETDEAGAKLSYDTGLATFSVETNYNLQTMQPRQLDLVSSFYMHCVRVSLTWKTVDAAVLLSASLF